MCLIVYKNKSKIADHDIHCFKIVLYENDKYYTGYRHEFITCTKDIIGFLFTDIFTLSINNWIYPDVSSPFIECGVIHTFVTLEDALIHYNKYHDYRFLYALIFECIIPKGTEYIKGFFSAKFKSESYGSKAIRFIEKIV